MEKENKRILKYLKNLIPKIFFIFTNEASAYYRNRYTNNNEGGLRYICKCDCGNEIEVLESDLFTGKVTCCEDCK